MRTGLDRNDQPRHDHPAKSPCHNGGEYVELVEHIIVDANHLTKEKLVVNI